MGIERVDGKIQSGVQPPQSKKPGSGISREDAKARRVGDRVPQLPKTFCGNEGVLECSGLTELWMGIERVDGKIQSGVKPPQSKKEGSGISREGAKSRKGWGWPKCRSYPGLFVAMRGSWSAPAWRSLGWE
jgi:hypothetical protein